MNNHALEYRRASWTCESTSSFFGGRSCSCKTRGGEAEGHDSGSRKREKRDECQSGIDGEDLYDLLEAKMEGFQIANHPGTIGGFKNLNLTITKKWVEIPTLNLEEFEKCPADFSEYAPLARGWDGWK
ncbi:hypothetical protein R1flu_016034 [Riccia fluitans]|uniref:Uncharacterized protein n=1 Tax=Riccia fluitans TaxID=41844 RepID=A0ABD1YKV2_9MARC